MVSAAHGYSPGHLREEDLDSSPRSRSGELDALRDELQTLKEQFERLQQKISAPEALPSNSLPEEFSSLKETVKEIQLGMAILTSRIDQVEEDSRKSRADRIPTTASEFVTVKQLQQTIDHLIAAQTISLSRVLTAGDEKVQTAVDQAILSFMAGGLGFSSGIRDSATLKKYRHLKPAIDDMKQWFRDPNNDRTRYPYQWGNVGGEYVKLSGPRTELVSFNVPEHGQMGRRPIMTTNPDEERRERSRGETSGVKETAGQPGNDKDAPEKPHKRKRT